MAVGRVTTERQIGFRTVNLIKIRRCEQRIKPRGSVTDHVRKAARQRS
jgi:hypothetical protein